MRFVFPLETVLRLRRNLEERESQRLLAIDAQLTRARDEIVRVRAQVERVRDRMQQDMSGGMSGAELALETQILHGLAGRVIQVELAVQQLQQLRLNQLERLKHARMDREMLERLREQQFETYRLENSRREQRASDDLFLIRRAGSGA